MIKVSIVGISGYTGLELVKILINHPKFDITYVANSEGGCDLVSLHPSLERVFNTNIEKTSIEDIAKYSDLCFLALPHKASMSYAKELINLGVKVVDLSADYRLELDTYEQFYCPHTDKENLKNSVYGLPEFYRDNIKKSNLVANPGCYPTATLLALLPFIDYIDCSSNIFIDAKSGVSGAGKKLSETNSFVTINENIFAYNPLKHRHFPEIKEKVSLIKGVDTKINFVPHLISVTRGMLISIYATLKDDSINPNDILKEFYKDEEFIRVKDNPVDIKSTAGTNYCDIYALKNSNALFISSSIDNLLRGASSQAVVNANIMCELDENLAIPKIAYVP
jgi:N-acetyl-gamma-glutamyl-phosphate reductase